jgi:transmembrane sensor
MRQVSDDWTDADQAGLQAWLAADARHADAYGQVLEAMSAFDDQDDAADLRALRQQLQDSAAPLPGARRSSPRPSRRAWMIGAGALAAGLVGFGVLSRPSPARIYIAPAGAPAEFNLADGSRLSIEGGGAVAVRLGRHARDLELTRGQARFEVAHDKARPFSVTVGDQVVVATGTMFNIDRLSERSVVSLLEGRVIIHPVRGEGPTLVLAPGEQAVLRPGSLPLRQTADVRSAAAWRNGRLIFDDTPLAEAVERVNRYGANLRLGDEALARLRVTGVFKAGDNAAFVEAITAYLPIAARRGADGRTALVQRPAGG